jgi:hypothetical protein
VLVTLPRLPDRFPCKSGDRIYEPCAVRTGFRVLLPDEGCALLDELRRREGEMQ